MTLKLHQDEQNDHFKVRILKFSIPDNAIQNLLMIDLILIIDCLYQPNV